MDGPDEGDDGQIMDESDDGRTADVGDGCFRPKTAGPGDWSPRQVKVATLLAAGLRVAATAKAAGVGARTIGTWQMDPEFRRLVASIRDRLTDRAVGLLSRNVATAARRLAQLVRSENEGIALRAALGLLDVAARYRDRADLEERVAQLEARLAESKGWRR